jgi:hypothetical protein
MLDGCRERSMTLALRMNNGRSECFQHPTEADSWADFRHSRDARALRTGRQKRFAHEDAGRRAKRFM